MKALQYLILTLIMSIPFHYARIQGAKNVSNSEDVLHTPLNDNNKENNTKHAQEDDLIEAVHVDQNTIKVIINKRFKQRYLLSDFFAVYSHDIDLSKLDYSIQIMPFLMNVVSIVWISGHTFYVDSMDEELYESLQKVKEVLRRMYKRTKWNGELLPRKLVKNNYFSESTGANQQIAGANHTISNAQQQSQVSFNANSALETDKRERMALLFSGGVDSTASSLFHRHKKQLLITLWGHWDLPLGDKKLWNIRKDHLEGFARKYGHENSFIRSNYYSFLNRQVLDNLSPEISSWRIFTVEGIGWSGLAAPLMILKGYRELRHASTITWDFNYPAAANPFIDDNIKFAGCCLKHDLFDMNRLEKCEYIDRECKQNNLKQPFIRVCEEKTVGNCNKCQKCVRTILEFIVAGAEPRDYGFNIDSAVALKKSKSFMAHHTTGYTTVWHFKHIQQRLKEKLKKGEPVHEDLEWILSVNLNKKITTDVKYQRKIHWEEFSDLLPELEIPEEADE